MFTYNHEDNPVGAYQIKHLNEHDIAYLFKH